MHNADFPNIIAQHFSRGVYQICVGLWGIQNSNYLCNKAPTPPPLKSVLEFLNAMLLSPWLFSTWLAENSLIAAVSEWLTVDLSLFFLDSSKQKQWCVLLFICLVNLVFLVLQSACIL